LKWVALYWAYRKFRPNNSKHDDNPKQTHELKSIFFVPLPFLILISELKKALTLFYTRPTISTAHMIKINYTRDFSFLFFFLTPFHFWTALPNKVSPTIHNWVSVLIINAILQAGPHHMNYEDKPNSIHLKIMCGNFRVFFPH
jgi:hypothetical protein